MEGRNSNSRGKIISCIKSCKLITKECLHHIVKVRDVEHEVPSIESVPIVREVLEVFPDELPGVSPE